MFFKNYDLMTFKLVLIFQINNFKPQKLNWMSTFMSKLLFFEKVHNWMLNFKNFRIDKADFLTAKEQKRSIINYNETSSLYTSRDLQINQKRIEMKGTGGHNQTRIKISFGTSTPIIIT